MYKNQNHFHRAHHSIYDRATLAQKLYLNLSDPKNLNHSLKNSS